MVEKLGWEISEGRDTSSQRHSCNASSQCLERRTLVCLTLYMLLHLALCLASSRLSINFYWMNE